MYCVSQEKLETARSLTKIIKNHGSFILYICFTLLVVKSRSSLFLFRVLVWHFLNYSWMMSVYLGRRMHILNFLSNVNLITVFWSLCGLKTTPYSVRKTGQLKIEKRAHLVFCSFVCCPTCNLQYHNCVLNPANNQAHCLSQAYSCVSKCLTESSMNITIEGLVTSRIWQQKISN